MFSEAREREINELFEKNMKLLPDAGEKLRAEVEKCEPDTAWLLKYLYGHMIVSDMVNVPFSTYLDYAKHGAFLWKHGVFREKISEDLFLNYVVYHRINEENILPCRSLFYEQAKESLENKTMEEAVLAANYWCASQVTYRSTDDRTLSPLTVFLNGYGRCGEESTFTTSVLRSLGIPARQVYAPRWSHCDDNHAWTEFWCDGTWKFLGACEPEQVSNSGWFLNASSRAMMVHSRRFDELDGETVVGKDGLVTVSAQLDRYAEVKLLEVSVKREDQTPAEGVSLIYEVINYAEYAPIAKQVTDADGKAVLMTGKGTLIVTAEDGEKKAQAVVPGEALQCELILADEAAPGKDWEALEFLAPADCEVKKAVLSEETKAEGERLLKAAVAKRLEKMASFYCEEKAQELKAVYGDVETEEFLRKAEANFEEIYCFLKPSTERELRVQMLRELTLKDFRDVKAEVLEDYLQESLAWKDQYPAEIFHSCLLNPRVEWENLSIARKNLREAFSKEQQNAFRENPTALWQEIEATVSVDPALDFEAVVTDPKPCLENRTGNARSRNILFVAVCRSLGIPARLNPYTREPEYYDNGVFAAANGCDAVGTLVLTRNSEEESWVYRQNFTVGRKVGSHFVTLSLDGLAWEDKELKAELPVGEYRIVTANRLPNGNVFVNRKIINVCEKKSHTEQLVLKEAKLSQMLEKITLPQFSVKDADGKEIAAEALGAGKQTLWIWLEESKEPTEHILNELYERKEGFSEIDGQIICLIRSEKALSDPTFTRTRGVLPQIQIYYDSFAEYYDKISRRMYQDPDSLPLILVTDEKMNGIYATCGYNVGTGDMLLRILGGEQ